MSGLVGHGVCGEGQVMGVHQLVEEEVKTNPGQLERGLSGVSVRCYGQGLVS